MAEFEHLEYLYPLSWDPLQSLVVDVDSCATAIEGIDMLAEMNGTKHEVEKLTTSAMDGNVPFDEVFALRLEIIQPKENDLLLVGKQYLNTITPHVPKVIEIAQSQGVDIFLLSGGYDTAIYPLADYLNVPREQVFANHLFFHHGAYAGFDDKNPLCGKSGKLALIKLLRLQRKLWGRIGIVGDGISEVETKSVVDLCIGFGGHVAREKVLKEADVFISQPTFSPVLPLILGRQGIEECAKFHRHMRSFIRDGLNCLNQAKFQHRAIMLNQQILQWRTNEEGQLNENHPLSPIWLGN